MGKRCHQLKPLEARMTDARAAARETKHEYRRQLSIEHAKTRGMVVGCMMVLRRRFWGRLKWLVFGR